MAIMVQYDFRPIPGKKLAALVESCQVAANIWKKHGAKPSLWTVGVGEVGNMSFTVSFATYSEYGKCLDAVTMDPEFRAWQARNTESGNAEWVRSNLLREMQL